jgi:hypothetical protein
MRREFLKGYILALLADGDLRGAKTPAAAVKRVLAAIAEDAPVVVGEIIGTVAANGLEALKRGASRVHEKLGEKVGAVIDDIKARGFGEFWKDMQETYARGVEENARRGG